MMLIISTCKEKFHELEFVKPVEDIVGRGFMTKHYLDVNGDDLKEAGKVVICGTSLKDSEYLKNLDKFEWLKDFDKPVFGICAGMQIIGFIFGGEFKKKREIGYYFESFTKDFFGLKGKQEIYHLHNNYVSFSDEFIQYVDSEIPQAVKHKDKEIYGCLFHPEVRNKEVISKFIC